MYKTEEITNKDEWEKYLLSQNPGTFLQSWNWGETNRLSGFRIKRLGFYSSKKLVGIAQLIHQPARRGPHFLIPGGPVVDYDNEKLTSFVFDEIKKFAKKEKAWFVRVRPDVVDSEKIRKRFEIAELKSAPMHLHGEHTLILDISKSEEEILKGMRKTTRYLIRKSFNEGYEIRTSIDPKDASVLYELQKQTVERHKFVGFPRRLFEAQLETFGKDNQGELFICEKNKEPLVAAIIIYYANKAFYHHSGSSRSARRTNASYFTQWQIIRKAKELGYKYYDFWGIAPTENPRHRFAGVTIFKKGFGGKRVDWVHAHDLPVNPLYKFTYLFESVRRLSRRL